MLTHAFAFMLCKGSVHCHHGLHPFLIQPDIFFFKIYIDSQFTELPQDFQHIQCISSEPTEGFRQDQIDFIFTSILHDPQELVPIVRPHTGGVLLVNLHQTPAFCCLDFLAVHLLLQFQAAGLLFVLCADSAICGHTQCSPCGAFVLSRQAFYWFSHYDSLIKMYRIARKDGDFYDFPNIPVAIFASKCKNAAVDTTAAFGSNQYSVYRKIDKPPSW